MARMPKALVAAGTLAAVLWCSAAQAGPPGSTVLLSRPAGFGALTPPAVNDSFSSSTSLSAIGNGAHPGRRLMGGPSDTTRYTVFVSRADGLSADDNDSVENVYVRDAVNDTTTLVSRAGDGTAANADSENPAISSDGRYVAFESRATNLVSGVDPNGTTQIYRRDLLNGTTALMSRATGASGTIADADAYEASVATGGSVAFSSFASNLGGGSGTHSQVYVRTSSTTTIVSVPSGTTTPGDSDSYGPSLSDDGKVVAFSTDATNIGASDANARSDVFAHNNLSGATTLASQVTGGGAYGNGDSSGASISADGHRVAFISSSTNLSASDASTDADAYVHDFGASGTTFLVSRVNAGKADAPSSDASISADGVKVAFVTAATNLSGTDTNGVTDVYVRDTTALSTPLGSRCQGAALLTLPAFEGAIAPNGTRVAFTTHSDGCSPQQDDDFSQVFNRGLGLAPVGVELTQWVSRPSGTGDFKSGTSHSALHGFYRANDTASALSGDGSVAAFISASDELSPDDNNRVTNVFARDAKAGTTELVSRASGADGAAGNASSGPPLFGGGIGITASSPAAISDDGRYVAFTSTANNLVPGDGNGATDVFVRDRVAQTTTLVSVKSDGSQVNSASYDPDISADGNRIAFTSNARLDPAADPSTDASIYVRDLAAGTTTLASRQNGAAGTDADQEVISPAISADGNRVVFSTPATNLAPGLIDGNGDFDIYMRDLAANTTSLVSTRNALGTAGDFGANAPDIDANGTHVAFSSSSTNMVGADDVNDTTDVFVRTIGTPTTTLVSQGPGGAAGNSFSIRPSISADGNRIAFSTGATDLFPGDTDAAPDVLLRDVGAGTTTLVSRGDGVEGALPNAIADYPSISADGHCVAFDSPADNLVAGPAGTDFLHSYLRAIDADCGTPPPPAPAPGPAPGPAADTVAPSLSSLKVSPSRFKVSSKPTAVSAKKKKVPKGTKIKFKLSEAASVTLKIERKGKGRRKGKKCVAKRRTGKRCTLYTAKGTLRRNGKSGSNSVKFSGRVGSKKLPKGRYRVTARATDAAGNRSAKKTATFRVV